MVAHPPLECGDQGVVAGDHLGNRGVALRSAIADLFGLRPVAEPTDKFDSERVGLDHLSFTVPSVDDLTRTAARLAEAGIEHGEVTPLAAFGIAILSFSDPDGIHLELTAPL
jgi:catechol 2,3-dioxygenase-like lactoylglutathione lyase family enzyme